jgi:general secretion pathway protein A
MYREYFGLKEVPFSIAPDPHYFYISEGHREALAHLMYGINSDGGFVLLTGEVGTGKTTVCRCLIEQMPENCEVAFILNPKLSSVELLAAICDEFRITYPKGTETIKDLVARINDFLILIHETERRAILIIEEAQNLSVEVLEQVRLLTNLETSQRKLLQIIMLGQPELIKTLARPELRQLSQRITARFHLGPLAKHEIAAYVNHRLSVAGLVRGELFPQPVMRMLSGLTGGVPRLINVICDRALLGSYTQGLESVDKKTLVTAANEVSGKRNKRWQQKTVYPWIAAVFLIALIVAGAAYYMQSLMLTTTRKSTMASAKTAVNASGEDKQATTTLVSSRERAYQSLFNAWQITYDPKNSLTACEQAQKQGLLCQEGKGTLETLRLINKPVLLRLIDTEGKDYYLTLTALHGDNVTYTMDNEIKSDNINEIIRRWSGDYEVLWRLPKEYTETLKPGGRGTFVMWLDKQLASLEGKKARSQPKSTYDDEMVKKVKTFQTAVRLKPDGIVDPTTIAQLIMKTGSDGPMLDDKKGVN